MFCPNMLFRICFALQLCLIICPTKFCHTNVTFCPPMFILQFNLMIVCPTMVCAYICTIMLIYPADFSNCFPVMPYLFLLCLFLLICHFSNKFVPPNKVVHIYIFVYQILLQVIAGVNVRFTFSEIFNIFLANS
jgi:hypothetical protein